MSKSIGRMAGLEPASTYSIMAQYYQLRVLPVELHAPFGQSRAISRARTTMRAIATSARMTFIVMMFISVSVI